MWDERERPPEFLPPIHQCVVQVEPIRRGLESDGVSRLKLRRRNDGALVFHCVVKRLRGRHQREARVYQQFLSSEFPRVAPRLVGVEERESEWRLYLESVRQACAWPWRRFSESSRVLSVLARLHRSATPVESDDGDSVSFWDYEGELRWQGHRLLKVLEQNKDHPVLGDMRPNRRAVSRLLDRLDMIRARLISCPTYGARFIHGDVHSGNVIMRVNRGKLEPVLVDWGRSRIGSPLEDVSSWLQSLAYWEPEVRRRHDSLLRFYLAELGMPARLGESVREAYWLAGACNVLSGAALYHLSNALNVELSLHRRTDAARAADDCLRIVRRASAVV